MEHEARAQHGGGLRHPVTADREQRDGAEHGAQQDQTGHRFGAGADAGFPVGQQADGVQDRQPNGGTERQPGDARRARVHQGGWQGGIGPAGTRAGHHRAGPG